MEQKKLEGKINLLSLNKGVNKLFSKYKYFILVLVIGIIFIGFPVAGDTPHTNDFKEETNFNINEFEKKLENAISSISGAGKTSVVLTLLSTEESIYATDIKSDITDEKNKKLEENITVISTGSYGEEPLLIKKIYPTFKGVGVICEGGDSSVTKLKITEFLTSVLGIGVKDISISKMK